MRQLPSKRRKIVFALCSVLTGLVLAGVLTESIFQVLQYWEGAQKFSEGTGGTMIPDDRWGWKPAKGPFRRVTAEFDVTGFVNELHMNGQPYNPGEDEDRTRVVVLGDSHTFAAGVSMEENWPQVLQQLLNDKYGPDTFVTYNTAASNYSLQHYLLRLIDQGPLLNPHYVVVAISFATDLYDLLPPARGIGYYPPKKGLKMAYFDFDPSGQLIESHWDSTVHASAIDRRQGEHPGRKVRRLLGRFATFRYLRRSRLALFIGSHVKIGGQSLWPNMEIVVEREISWDHEYHWRLFEALLLRIEQESEKLGARLIVVGIPYLPQVYDEIWQSTFAGNEKYSRTAAIERLQSWCAANGIEYVDILEPFRQDVATHGQWLHHAKDAHPTAKGHRLIAQTIVGQGVIEPDGR